MCSSSPKMPSPSEQDKPAVLLTARDGNQPATADASAGRQKFRLDLNSATSTPYGSSLVIPT
jgi:hypothetical protein